MQVWWVYNVSADFLLAAGVLGDGLGAFTDSVLGQFTGQQETDSGLDLPAGDGGTLVVVGQSGSFSGDSLKDIVDEAVHDRHGLATDASVGVHLFQHLVDVDGIAFLPFPLAFLVAGANSLCLAGFLGALGANFGRHGYRLNATSKGNDVRAARNRLVLFSASGAHALLCTNGAFRLVSFPLSRRVCSARIAGNI